jgi:hypothetical protein
MDESFTVDFKPQLLRSKMSWRQRLLAMGFMFFLIKGLLWLLVPAAITAVAWLR